MHPLKKDKIKMTKDYMLNSVFTIPEIARACKHDRSFKSGEISIKCLVFCLLPEDRRCLPRDSYREKLSRPFSVELTYPLDS